MPGVTVHLIRVPTAQFNPTGPGKWFCAQLFEKGSTTAPILVTSMTEFEEFMGKRISYSPMWDVAETFFEEGGSELFLARVVGDTPVIASLKLKDGLAAEALIVSAKNAGEWGNEIEPEVVAAGAGEEYRLKVFLNKVLVEESPILATQLAAVTWSEASAYINITVGAGTKPPAVVAAAKLTGGDYNSAGLTTDSWEDAFELFDIGLGCGQVSAPGNTTEAIAKAVEAHAEAKNRTALLDLTDSPTPGTLITAAALLRAVTGARRSAAYAPWAIIPGLAQEAPRKVPYSAVQAGILARNDASATPPPVGEASAGDFGRPRFAIGLSQSNWTRAQREELNEGSVNVARTLPSGQIETYGNRTLVSPSVEPAWEEVSAARIFMFVYAEGEALLEKAVFKNIDPKKLLFAKVEGKLSGFLKSLGGMLWSYSVDTGPAVNTKATIAKKEVLANVEVKPSEIAETVVLNLSAAA